MHTVMRAADAAELLALVPVLAGYRPHESLTFVLFEGRRSLGVMRFNLPDDDDEVDRIAATLIGYACKVRAADGIAVVVFTESDLVDRAGGALAHDDLVGAILARADSCGLGVKEALCWAGDAWGSYLDASRVPRSLDEIARRQDDAPIPLPRVIASQADGADLPEFDLAARERVGRALAEIAAAVDDQDDPHPAPGSAPAELRVIAALGVLGDPPQLFEDALSWDAAAPDPLAASCLIWCLARPLLRDVALRQWCYDQVAGDETFDAQLSWHEGVSFPPRIAQHLWGEGPVPDPDRLKRALTLVRAMASLAPRHARPGVLSAAAWLSWALGRSTHAASYARMAIEIDPDHGLSDIVLTMTSAGHLPEWAFRRRPPHPGRASTSRAGTGSSHGSPVP